MDLATRLRARRAEIEAALFARAYAVADPSEVEDPEYTLGLREAVGEALDYAIAGVESSQRASPPPPEGLLAQARAAARAGVSLDTVLRRYSSGYSLLGDLLIAETGEGDEIPGTELKRSLRRLAGVFDGLVAAVSSAYGEEDRRRPKSPAQRRAELTRTLLAGEAADPKELGYALAGWHIALIVRGPGAAASLREFAQRLDRNLLLVHPDGEAVWAWLGGRRRLGAGDVLGLARSDLPAEVAVAIGEPGEALEGWRLSHRQAQAAMPVARRGSPSRVRYADVALLASALRDEVLARSLTEIYLKPLEAERDGGAVLRGTLAAYLSCGRSVSSAAAALGVARQTVSIRLRRIEERIDRRLEHCAAEIEIALRLAELVDKPP